MEHNKNKWLIGMGVGLLVYTAVIVGITNCDTLGIETSNDWIGYYGSIAGGVLTLIGVYITIKHSEENRKDDFRKSIMPVIYIEICNTGNVCTTETGEIAGDEFHYDEVEKTESVCFRIALRNIGMKAAKNLKIGVINKNGDWEDLGNNLLLQVGDRHVFPLGVQLYDLNYYENKRITRTIVFRVKFQDLIGGNYIQDIKVDVEPKEGGDNWYYFCENGENLESEYVRK